MSGVGGEEANCTKAASFVRVVLQERRGWSEDIALAVEALDDGKPDVCHPLFPKMLPVIFRCTPSATIRQNMAASMQPV